MKIHNSFVEWVEDQVIPLQALHPDWFRLDGWTSGGNRKGIGKFFHDGRKWIVHSDSHFEPILIAYQFIIAHTETEPFYIKPALTRNSLNLKSEIWNPNGPKYFYVYEVLS